LNKLLPLLAFSVLLLAPVGVQNAFANANPADIVFENGNPDPSNGLFMTTETPLDDFVLDENTELTDVHFIMGCVDSEPCAFDGTITYFVFTDLNDFPDDMIATDSVNVVPEQIADGPSGPRFLVWFDLIEPISIVGGEKYWLGLNANQGFANDGFYWEITDNDFGVANWNANPNDFVNLFRIGTDGLWFQLTSKVQVVGGEFLPIDSTALLLAGTQSFSWMIPLVLSGIGIGLFVVSRKSENS